MYIIPTLGWNPREKECIQQASSRIHSPKVTWNLKRGPLQTTVLFNGLLVRFYVGLGECSSQLLGVRLLRWGLWGDPSQSAFVGPFRIVSRWVESQCLRLTCFK